MSIVNRVYPLHYDNIKDVCKICYNNECDESHKCTTCDNSICISCLVKIKKDVINEEKQSYNYKCKCPFCREEKLYTIKDLDKETTDKLVYEDIINQKVKRERHSLDAFILVKSEYTQRANTLLLETKQQLECIMDLFKDKKDKEFKEIKYNFRDDLFKVIQFKDDQLDDLYDKNVKLKEKIFELNNDKIRDENQLRYISYLENKNKLLQQDKQKNEEYFTIIQKLDELLNNNSKQRGDNKKIVKDAKNLIKNIKEERQIYNLDISIKLR